MTAEIVGLIPAAGKAERIAPLPCSKEVFPVGFQEVKEGKGKRPKVVCSYLLENMRNAGVSKAFIVLRSGKWDIPSYLEDGEALRMSVAFLLMGLPYGVPYTLDQAYPFVRDSRVAFGFPDILFEPGDAFAQLATPRTAVEPDVVLGLFPAGHRDRVDLVDLEADGSVRRIAVKPTDSSLRYSWAIAIWTPVFTRFLHEHLASIERSGVRGKEMSVGDVIDAAIRDGMRVEGRVVSDQPYLDIGTPEDLIKAVRLFSAR